MGARTVARAKIPSKAGNEKFTMLYNVASKPCMISELPPVQQIHRDNFSLSPPSLPPISLRKEFPNFTEERFRFFRMNPMCRAGDCAKLRLRKQLSDRCHIFVANII